MTTIAIKDGIVAFDSRISDGDLAHPGVIQKVWISKKHPVIYCGYGGIAEWWTAGQYLDTIHKLPWEQRRWDNTNFPDLGDAAGLMVVTPAFQVYSFEGKRWYPVTGPRYAAGTGAKAALGAMLAGASAKKAVEIAIKLDPNSGPPVRTLRVSDIPVSR